MPSWSDIAEKRGIRYFLISFVDLFGAMRAKLVPASAMDGVAKSGAGFAGFAAWFDMTPADPDVLVMPEQDSVIQLPWKSEVAWTTGGTSDARFIRALCPVVELGLVGKTLHQVDERAPLSEIRQLQAVYERLIARYFEAFA